MNLLRFEWDPEKASSNIEKHSVSFEEAVTVFDDDFARMIFDPDHSEDEDRFILLGLSFKLRILVVIHCYKESEDLIRINSARKATKKENKQYQEHLS